MTEIVLATLLMTVLILVLALTVMAARRLLLPSRPVTITVNGSTRIEGTTGQKLLPILKSADLLIPSACAGAGTCGLCKVKLLDGGGEPLPTETAMLGRRDVTDGFRLACQVMVRGPISLTVPDDVLSAETFDCAVEATTSLAPLMKEIVLAVPETTDFNFRAGTFAEITAPPYELPFDRIEIAARFEPVWEALGLRGKKAATDVPVTRAYSIANRPQDAGRIVLNIRLAGPPPNAPDAPPGVVSSYLFGLKPGDTVAVSGPFGSFGAKETDKEMVFIGGGVGMAPLRAIVCDQLERAGAERRISFWYGARGRADLFYSDEFDALAEKHANFRWTPALSDPEPGEGWEGPVGFVHDVAYRNYLKDHPAPEDCEYYLCGPPLMIRSVTAMLADLGVDEQSIFFDDFGS